MMPQWEVGIAYILSGKAQYIAIIHTLFALSDANIVNFIVIMTVGT